MTVVFHVGMYGFLYRTAECDAVHISPYEEERVRGRATQFEYTLVEPAGVFRSDILNLDSLAPDSALAEPRKEEGNLPVRA